MAVLLRATVVGDGTLKAQFSDGSLLLLAPRGSAFVHVDSSGASLSGVTQYALHGLQPKLEVALKLRNTHCWRPTLCRPFLQAQPRQGFASAVPMEAVRWPGSVTAARDQELLEVVPGSGTVSLTSEDRCARLDLHPCGLRLTVAWPVAVEGAGGRSVFITQSFSAGDVPLCWAGPLRLAATVLAQQRGGSGSEADGSGELEGGGQSSPDSLTPGERISQLPPAAGMSAAGVEVCTFPPQSWWLDSGTATFSPNLPTLLEWTRGAVYQYLPSLQQVEVVLPSDGSILRLDRRGYLHHFCPDSWAQPRTWAPQAVPLWGGPPEARYRLGEIAAHAAALREISARLYSVGKAAGVSPLSGNPVEVQPAAASAALGFSTLPPSTLPPQAAPGLVGPGNSSPDGRRCSEDNAAAVRERQVVPGMGTFTAFADSRVHASFEDSTFLTLLPGGQSFQALLPSGQIVTAPTAQPAELQPQLLATREFAEWAARPPLERGLSLQWRQDIRAQLSSTQRQVAVCSLAVSGSICGCPGDSCQDAPELEGVPGAQGATAAGLHSGSPGAGGQAEGGVAADADYMWQLVEGSMHLMPRGTSEREAFVEAWLRRNALLMDQL